MNNRSAFIKYLESHKNSCENTIAKVVAEEALDRDYEEVKNWFEDLLHHGCISGMVSSMIYYTDTHAFFDDYYDEIMQIKESYEEEIGQPMNIPYTLKNYLAWFAYEEVARTLYSQFEG